MIDWATIEYNVSDSPTPVVIGRIGNNDLKCIYFDANLTLAQGANSFSKQIPTTSLPASATIVGISTMFSLGDDRNESYYSTSTDYSRVFLRKYANSYWTTQYRIGANAAGSMYCLTKIIYY